MKGLFISGASTGVGKTFVTRSLAAALTAQNRRVAAIKPVETGMKDEASSDAAALARACGRPEVANDPGFYRGKLAVSPYAATARVLITRDASSVSSKWCFSLPMIW